MPDSSTADPMTPKYKRVLLKLSGEAFGHGGKSGISLEETLSLAAQMKRLVERKVLAGKHIRDQVRRTLTGAHVTEDVEVASEPERLSLAARRVNANHLRADQAPGVPNGGVQHGSD